MKLFFFYKNLNKTISGSKIVQKHVNNLTITFGKIGENMDPSHIHLAINGRDLVKIQHCCKDSSKTLEWWHEKSSEG